MAESRQTNSRKLLVSLRETLAASSEGQARLDHITSLIAQSLGTEVCSIYLYCDSETLELCATEGLNKAAVHQTRMRVGEGLVGFVARRSRAVNTQNAPAEPGFRYMPETGEEIYSSFLGVPIQRLGETIGVLVVQSRDARQFSSDEQYGLEIVAMVLAEMTELGAFVDENEAMTALHQRPAVFTGMVAQEGRAEGHVWLHEPRVVVTNPVADDPDLEWARLENAVDQLRISVDELLEDANPADKEQKQVLEAYRMFAHSKGWLRRMHEDIERGLSAEAAVEMEQSTARSRLKKSPDPYLRERLHDLDDLSNRLLRILTGQGKDTGAEMPQNPVLIATNIGPGDLLEYGNDLRAIVLEEGSVASHAAIVARALAIPLIVQSGAIATEALNGDPILVDGEAGSIHLRPDEAVTTAFRDQIGMEAQQKERYASLRDKPATSLCGTEITLKMNAGLMADLPSLGKSGASGVGLFRTELQFLTVNRVPQRGDLIANYQRVISAAGGLPVTFRTLDIGSDKVLSYMNPINEPNPALGWRALRLGLDKPGLMRRQLQALSRATAGKKLSIMFPFVAQLDEFRTARQMLLDEIKLEKRKGYDVPSDIEIGAMLETPSMAFASHVFFELADFISIGGNDLKQFFFAADRENERVRRRYDTLNVSYLSLIEQIIKRCNDAGTPLSFCGEDAGRPVEAICLSAIGLRHLSMRPASIGPVKHRIRSTNLTELRDVINDAKSRGVQNVREDVERYLSK